MIKVELMDSKQQALASAICAGHSHIWNVFFGWRKTFKRCNKDVEVYYLTDKDWKEIKTIYEYYFGR